MKTTLVNGKKARLSVGWKVFVIGLALIAAGIFAVSSAIKLNLFAPTPSAVSAAAAAPANALLQAFGNTSSKMYAGVVNKLASGVTIGNFNVVTAASITNGTNATYNPGSAIGGVSLYTFNGTIGNGQTLDLVVQFVVNASASGTVLTIPVQKIDNASLGAFQVTDINVVGLGAASSYSSDLSVASTNQPSTTGSTPYTLPQTLTQKGTYVLTLTVKTIKSIASGNALKTYQLYALGGTSGANALANLNGAAYPGGAPQLNDFVMNWKV